ncbi:hypothetical protein SERLA73DRAFT_66808 [Serpula lacrymans var. lacrymans S7.3]|uniref:Uncharacterized protein n=2 Tax=Serpula lacrymans var. lacrymans TaxID=341189 RepID=F8QIR4_SERL3|nr:uncharacterized protein SERLADRAFT_367700 [Serpula lacrymans var. lacrymans S7.9]EGN91812.1 hypothetical protein SERLA73DRAFT_66808 [Serpula lacrymans var. lacrymans S7.3]EGO26068.1 hypothetical protein SERLADRAFT_367700 [Serpula lacrymans var. lacrymans S7.9]
MFRNFTSTLAAVNAGGKKDDAKKSISPTLRTDIYSAMDQTKAWLGGEGGGGQAGDGVSYGSIVSTIQKHFPDITVGLDSVGQAEGEVAIVVGGVTNMILEMSKWDGMAGGMAMRTWVDTLSDAHGRISADRGGVKISRKELVGRGITRGVNQLTDVTLMTREFAARIQIISLLKSVNTKIHGTGSDQARQGEALWSSKFI